MKAEEYRTIKLWLPTYRRLKLIAATTGESLVGVLERLAQREQARLQRKEQDS